MICSSSWVVWADRGSRWAVIFQPRPTLYMSRMWLKFRCNLDGRQPQNANNFHVATRIARYISPIIPQTSPVLPTVEQRASSVAEFRWVLRCKAVKVTGSSILHVHVSAMVPVLIPVLGGQPAGDRCHNPAASRYFPPGPGYLPYHVPSPHFGRYQVILPDDRDRQMWTTCPGTWSHPATGNQTRVHM